MTGDQKAADRGTAATDPAVNSEEAGVYLYEPAGIRERSGYIPLWLKLVALGLIFWGISYAIRYWSSY